MNPQQIEYIKLFLNKCKIKIDNLNELNDMLIPRENLLDKEIYNSIKEDISLLKQVFTSSALTSLQSTAEDHQKWPLLNLVRQILRSCNYKMTPKRVSAGYTKDGKKIFKRMFIIEKLKKIENNYTLDTESSTLDTESSSLSVSTATSSINASSSITLSGSTSLN